MRAESYRVGWALSDRTGQTRSRGACRPNFEVDQRTVFLRQHGSDAGSEAHGGPSPIYRLKLPLASSHHK